MLHTCKWTMTQSILQKTILPTYCQYVQWAVLRFSFCSRNCIIKLPCWVLSSRWVNISAEDYIYFCRCVSVFDESNTWWDTAHSSSFAHQGPWLNMGAHYWECGTAAELYHQIRGIHRRSVFSFNSYVRNDFFRSKDVGVGSWTKSGMLSYFYWSVWI